MHSAVEVVFLPRADRNEVLSAARRVAATLRDVERRLQADGVTVPPREVKQEVTAAFWSLGATIEQFERAGGITSNEIVRSVQEMLGPWLFRSRHFSRAFWKPHGQAGDYRMLENIYDLEDDLCADPSEPAIVNVLDHLFSTLHSVRSLWERRRRLQQLLSREYGRTEGQLRILALATGAVRALVDFLVSLPESREVSLTLIDPDPAALAYCRQHALPFWERQLTCLVAPLTALPSVLPAGEFDVVIAHSVLDYLDDAGAREMLAYLAWRMAPGAALSASNHHPHDPSRFSKRWLMDWPLHCRDERMLASLFPPPVSLQMSLSTNGALTYALGRK